MDRIKIKAVLLVITYVIAFIGFFSVAPYIDITYLGIFGLFFIAGIFFDYKERHLIPRFVLNIFALLFIIFKFLTIPLDDPVVPIIEAIVFLVSIKLVEDKKFRDYLQIYILSIFLLAGSALVSFDITFMIYFGSLFFLITFAVVILAFYSEDQNLVVDKKVLLKIMSVGFIIPVVAIPLTILLFVILPRTDYPLFSFLNHGVKANTGFSDSVKLGEVSDIQEDNSIVMRVSMPKVNPKFLYWRGIVLSFFDGTEWKRVENFEKNAYVEGNKIKQTVILEPYEDKYLFALDKPVIIYQKDILASDDLVFHKNHKIKRRLKYEAISILSDRIIVKNIERDIYLQVPDSVKEKINPLAISLKKETPVKTVFAVLNFLNQNFVYSLDDLPVSSNPIVDFLMKHRKGNCEYFASAAAVLLRLNGVPTRLVAGYKGGNYNEIGGYYVIPQKNAHVWIEVYLDGAWYRFDPTPVSIELYVNKNSTLKEKIQMILDTFEYYWINSVINFDFQKQVAVFKKLKSKIEKPRVNLSVKKELVLLYASVVAILILLFILLYRIYRYITTPVEKRILDKFYSKLSKAGYKKLETEGLFDFVNRIQDEELRQKALQFAIKFSSLFYKDKKFKKEDTKALKEIISKL